MLYQINVLKACARLGLVARTDLPLADQGVHVQREPALPQRRAARRRHGLQVRRQGQIGPRLRAGRPGHVRLQDGPTVPLLQAQPHLRRDERGLRRNQRGFPQGDAQRPAGAHFQAERQEPGLGGLQGREPGRQGGNGGY